MLPRAKARRAGVATMLAALRGGRSVPSLAALLAWAGCACALAPARAATAQALPAEVPSPAQHLGHALAADSTLPDWAAVSSYFLRLDQASERVQTSVVGRSTEGRDFLLCAVSSAANLARADQLRAHAARLADPRGAGPAELDLALEEGLPILMISSAMHSNETAAPQFAMRLAHELATSDEEPFVSARENTLVLILPCTNPDGLDIVSDWVDRTTGTPFEASGMTELYQRYAGHDNNRDWFMLALEETRIVSRLLYKEWFPTVYWDVHQQGQSAERMFVPPFRDPLNPNLDPAIITGIGLLGSRALHDMTKAGFTGVATGVTFDMWWNGGNRNVPVRHNIVGLLTEAASVEMAAPVFVPPQRLRAPGELAHYAASNRFPAPWPGGWWRLSDIVEYEMAFARSVLASLAREPRSWLENALGAAQRAVERGAQGTPRAWVVDLERSDAGAVARLARALDACGVELQQASTAIEADGRSYAAGSIVILRDQPYGQHVKDLFEIQRYPEGEPPYDVAGWTLPLLLGVERAECSELPRGTWRPSDPAQIEAALRPLDPSALDPRDTRSWTRVFQALQAGESADWDGERFQLRSAGGHFARAPRVGLYAPWTASMDEGWTRWVLEYVGVPYASVRNERVRAGALRADFDVLLLPDVSPATLQRGRASGSVFENVTRGLSPEGSLALEAFVREGGVLVAWEGAAEWLIDLFGVPLVDVARGKEAGAFACPGSVLRLVREGAVLKEHGLGLPPSLPVFFSGGRAWREAKGDEIKPSALGVEVLTRMRYAPRETLLSGWIKEPERIAGQAAWVTVKVGEGKLHLFGFSPVYRSWSQAAFQLLLRALLLDLRLERS